MFRRVLLAIFAVIATSPIAAQDHAVVREQRSLTIDGSKEVWRLVWRETPRDSESCGPADPELALTCPCSGAAYAQVGDLVLERKRADMPVERLPLSPLFAGSDMLINEHGSMAMLARWPTRPRDNDDNPTPAVIRARPTVPTMRLRDYNGDGIAGEFLLQVDSVPCGKHVLVAVGITRDNPRLHALTSAEHPERPLALYQWEWDALARKPRHEEIMDWRCGDHGAEEETTMILRTYQGRIHATRVTRICPDIPDGEGIRHHRGRFVDKVTKREVL